MSNSAQDKQDAKRLSKLLSEMFESKAEKRKRPKSTSSNQSKTTNKKPVWLMAGAAFFVLGLIVFQQNEPLGVMLAWGGVGLLLWRAGRFFLKTWGNVWALTAWIVCFAITVLLLFLFYQSAHIYASLGARLAPEFSVIDWHDLGADKVRELLIIGPLLAAILRFLAAMLDSLELTVFGLIGVMAFGVIQTAEVMPRVIRSSPRAMKAMIASFAKFKKIQPRGDEGAVVSKLYEQHNNYYEDFLTGLDWARFVAYCIDLIVCLIGAPIIVGGYGAWNTVKFTFGFGDVDWANIGRIFITLFFFEFTVWVLIQASKAVFFYSHIDKPVSQPRPERRRKTKAKTT
jgi:hypothetical protein